MTRDELIVLVMGEEASEVAQMASKLLRFGLFDTYPGKPSTNAELTHKELDDLHAMIELMNDELGFGYVPNRANIDAKKARFNQSIDVAK